MSDSIINHLFLPYDLPSSAEADYLIKSNHQNEHRILEHLIEFLGSAGIKNTLPIFSTLHNCVQNWLEIQNIENCSILNLQSIIQKLTPSDFLPLYFHTQNAAILIEIDENSLKQPLISSWQVCLPTEIITSSLEPHVSLFPSPTYRLADRSQLTSRTHCELLTDFMNNTIEYSKSYKASREFNEIRDVPVAHYVCQWWITHFEGIQIESHTDSFVSFKKKHRDQIRWKNSIAPFRRSGLWMTIKVVFHTILTKRLGTICAIIYKLLITAFLIDVVHMRQTTSELSSLATDLLIHCLRKIVRRLNKIECSLPVNDANDMNQWIENLKDQIKWKLDIISPKSDWQEVIKNNQATNQMLEITQLYPNRSVVCQHSCTKLKAYLNERSSDKSSDRSWSNYDFDPSTLTSAQGEDQLLSMAFLTTQAKYSIDIALTRMEIWVEFSLDQWINAPLQSNSDAERFEKLLSFFEDYQRAALDYYYAENELTDSISYSRFILTSLTIIRSMHRKLCANKSFERLNFHAIQIPHLLNLFELLVLPTREDMVRARDLLDFFHDFSSKSYPHILDDIEATDAFGIYFATHSASMKKTLEEIQTEVDQEKLDKIEAVNKAKSRYDQLIKKANSLNCECNSNQSFTQCTRCLTILKAKAIKVHIYECPIPSKQESALAVVFELQMPMEFRCYRDILWMFINRPNPEPKISMIEWLNVSPHAKLSRFCKGSRNNKVKLVSANKSISQTHYAAARQIATTSLNDFLYENSLLVQISPTKPTTLSDECRTLTPQLSGSTYKHLQFSVNTTQFVQNQVVARLSNCPVELKPTQYVDFGSFRSGHCLQWWNLLSTLELDSLSMDEESVAILISHALLQHGPVATDRSALICSWCPESHQPLLDDCFVDELISRLDRLLTHYDSNWQNELILVIITMIIIRILTLCNSTRIEQVTTLALKCRHTGEKWIQLISESIRNASSSELEQVVGLRDKIVLIGVACLLTFSVHRDRIDCLLSSNQHLICFLKH